jgi:hypothetical protein
VEKSCTGGLTHTVNGCKCQGVARKADIPDAVRAYLSTLGKKKKRITPADSLARSKRLACARTAITPDAIRRRTASRLANLRLKKSQRRPG